MDIDFMADAEGVGSKQMVMLPDRDEPISLHWGIPSNNREVAQIGLLRSETARIERPCLIIANEFGLVNGPREKYRASLITTEKFFCIAGVFHPGHRDWPPCFAALTVAAYPDLEPYKDRHVAIVRPDDWWDWLDKERDPLDILKPFPEGSFRVIGPPVQQGLSL